MNMLTNPPELVGRGGGNLKKFYKKAIVQIQSVWNYDHFLVKSKNAFKSSEDLFGFEEPPKIQMDFKVNFLD